MNMNIDEAREYLKDRLPSEHYNYINNHLAGDFAVAIANDYKTILYQLKAELKWRNDNDNN